jgi:HK97 family phage prohead protease
MPDPADLRIREADVTVRGKIKSYVGEIEVREPAGERVIAGIASAPNVDRYREVIDLEAFRATLDIYRKNPILLLYHDMRRPLGTVTLDLREDALYFEAELVKGTRDADEAWTNIKQGVLKAVSIGFRELETDIDIETGILHITKLELYELSVVTVPALREALFTVSGGKCVNIELLPEDIEHAEESVLIEKLSARGYHIQSAEPNGWITNTWPWTEGKCSWCEQEGSVTVVAHRKEPNGKLAELFESCLACLAPEEEMKKMLDRIAECEARIADCEVYVIDGVCERARAVAAKAGIDPDEDDSDSDDQPEPDATST